MKLCSSSTLFAYKIDMQIFNFCDGHMTTFRHPSAKSKLPTIAFIISSQPVLNTIKIYAIEGVILFSHSAHLTYSDTLDLNRCLFSCVNVYFVLTPYWI